jgi:hypothetical protein
MVGVITSVEVVGEIAYWIGVAKALPSQTIGSGFPETKVMVEFSFITIVPQKVSELQIPNELTV